MAKVELDGEENEVFVQELLLQYLLDFDRYMQSDLGNGIGSIDRWVFEKLQVERADRGLYLRMLETLRVAMEGDRELFESLELRLTDGAFPRLEYINRRAAIPLTIGGDGKNLKYWLRLPAMRQSDFDGQKYIYRLSSRGVDGLLEFLGLGCYGNPEKFGIIGNFRHYLEKMKLDKSTTHWWAGFGDRRSFVVAVSKVGRVDPVATHYFQLDGAYWASRTLPFDEAAQIGQEGDSRMIDSEVFRWGRWE